MPLCQRALPAGKSGLWGLLEIGAQRGDGERRDDGVKEEEEEEEEEEEKGRRREMVEGWRRVRWIFS